MNSPLFCTQGISLSLQLSRKRQQRLSFSSNNETTVQGDHSGETRFCWLCFSCSTVCPSLLGLVRIRQKWQSSWAILRNFKKKSMKHSLWPPWSPCAIKYIYKTQIKLNVFLCRLFPSGSTLEVLALFIMNAFPSISLGKWKGKQNDCSGRRWVIRRKKRSLSTFFVYSI